MPGQSILIVEDEIIIAREVEARLLELDYRIAGIASSGDEAIELAGLVQPDLVLMDIVLKGDIDGVEAAGRIRRLYDIPVIFVTAYADPETLDRAKITEPFAYLIKPFSERELTANIEMALYKHQAESRLRRLEHWFTAAMDDVADAVIATDRNGAITMFNAAAETITDWSRSEAIGRQVEEVFRLVDRGTGEPVSLEDPAAGPLVRFAGETHLLDRGGRPVPVDITTSAVRDDEDRPTGRVSVFRDVGVRPHIATSALRRDLARSTGGALTVEAVLQLCAEAVVRSLRAACVRIWTVDEGRDVLLLRASAGAASVDDGTRREIPLEHDGIARVARDRAPRLSNSPLAPPDVADQEWVRKERVAAFAAHPLMVADRLLGVTALYSRRPLGAGVLDALGSAAEVIATAVEQKQAEERLRLSVRRSAEKLQRITASSPAILYTLEPTDEGVRPTWVSENVTRLLGYSVEEALEPDWWSSNIHPDDRATVLAQASSMLEEELRAGEYRFLRKDREAIWIRDHSRLIRGEDGHAEQVVGAWLDITERRNLEEQFRQSQKIESVGRLAGGIAHDFNNLLTVISGAAELILNDLGPGARHYEDLMEVRRAAERASTLTRRLLAFSRKQVFQPRILELNATLTGMKGMLERLIGEDVGLAVQLEDGLSTIRADPGHIEQIVLNLAVNSRDAMPDGGLLTIETESVALDRAYAREHLGMAPGDYVLLAVTDTGVGMTAETRERIFEPFFTTKAEARGTGLGLSTVYGIVQQSGGHIWVYSEPDVGTTFKVYFPASGEPVTETQTRTPKPATGTETILLVEDEPAVRSIVIRVLRSAGYTVLEAADGKEARRIASEHPSRIHLLVTDVVLPDVRGPELARDLLQEAPDLSVLYVSGYTEDAVSRSGITDPHAQFLSKPFDLSSLTRKVREALDAPG